MKVGIVADRLNRQRTGIGNYVYNLTKEFAKTNENREKVCLISYEDSDLFPNLNKIIIKNPFKNITKKSFYFWHIYLQFKLKKNNFNLDIVHSPENTTLFIKLKSKKIVTVYDITPYVVPESFTPITLLRYKLLFSKTIKTADKIIAISNRTKKDLINYFNIPAKEIEVIYLAADEKFKLLNKEEINGIRQKYNLNFPFILYVGTLEARKNIPTLIKAFYKLKKKNIEHKLVIAGKKGWKYKNIFEIMEKLNLQNDVIFTGYVPDEDLPALYNVADLFVYPSLYEGFGLPPLEAMACGTPVITSNTSSLPEVVGDAGIMVDPYDVDGLADAMYEVLTDEGLRANMIKKGLERTEMFSWEKCARETLEVYKKVYNQTGGEK